MGYTLNFAAVWRDIDLLWAGLGMGLLLALVSIAIGAILGLAISFVLISESRARPLAAGTSLRSPPNIAPCSIRAARWSATDSA